MGKLFGRIVLYFICFVLLSLVFGGIHGTIAAFLLLAIVLALANGTLRPVLTFIAHPFNLLTAGSASVFVNMFMLVIARAIVGIVIIQGFWLMALVSLVIMAADALIRGIRLKNQSHTQS
jgi:uncharacterized membrane protein YvlD (DUF360 family)